MSEFCFVPMQDDYLPEAADIYNHYITNTTVTFHAQPLSREDMRAILFRKDPMYITYAILDGDSLCGYAYMAPYKEREAYRVSSEVTIYLKPGYGRKGIGSKVLALLEEHACKNGIHSFLAVICAENEASLGLFQRHGYFQCARFKEVGMKFGRLLDVIVMQKILD